MTESHTFRARGIAKWFHESQSMALVTETSACTIPPQLVMNKNFPIDRMKGKNLQLTIKVEEIDGDQTKHKCCPTEQDIKILYMDEIGEWYLWINQGKPDEHNLQIDYCPFCSVKLEDLFY